MQGRILAAAVTLLIADSAMADFITVGAGRDTTIWSSGDNVASGAGQFVFAGTSNDGAVRRGLLWFDLGAIPSGATILDVQLTLHMSNSNPFSGVQNVALHRLLDDWGEGESDSGVPGGSGAPATPGDATWIYRFSPTETWLNAGGDFAPAASDTQAVDGIGYYTWGSTPALISDVQGWVDDGAANFGWALLANEDALGTAKRFDSRENDDELLRPSLTIEYALLPGPAGWLLLSGLLGGRRRRSG